MDWGWALLGGILVMLWLVSRAVIRWVEVRAQLRVWGPGPYGNHDGARHRRESYARMPK